MVTLLLFNLQMCALRSTLRRISPPALAAFSLSQYSSRWIIWQHQSQEYLTVVATVCKSHSATTGKTKQNKKNQKQFNLTLVIVTLHSLQFLLKLKTHTKTSRGWDGEVRTTSTPACVVTLRHCHSLKTWVNIQHHNSPLKRSKG